MRAARAKMRKPAAMPPPMPALSLMERPKGGVVEVGEDFATAVGVETAVEVLTVPLPGRVLPDVLLPDVLLFDMPTLDLPAKFWVLAVRLTDDLDDTLATTETD